MIIVYVPKNPANSGNRYAIIIHSLHLTKFQVFFYAAVRIVSAEKLREKENLSDSLRFSALVVKTVISLIIALGLIRFLRLSCFD